MLHKAQLYRPRTYCVYINFFKLKDEELFLQKKALPWFINIDKEDMMLMFLNKYV